MIAKIASKGRITLPAEVLVELGVRPGDSLEILKTANGFLIRPHRVDTSKLAPLAGALRRGKGSFDLERFRTQHHERSLRD
jgi:AbrB family looped-hinge helix DNA binding protein